MVKRVFRSQVKTATRQCNNTTWQVKVLHSEPYSAKRHRHISKMYFKLWSKAEKKTTHDTESLLLSEFIIIIIKTSIFILWLEERRENMQTQTQPSLWEPTVLTTVLHPWRPEILKYFIIVDTFFITSFNCLSRLISLTKMSNICWFQFLKEKRFCYFLLILHLLIIANEENQFGELW